MKLTLISFFISVSLAALLATLPASADEANGCVTFQPPGVHNICTKPISVTLRTKGDKLWGLISTIKASTTFSDNTDQPIEFHACFNPNPLTGSMRGWDHRYNKCCDFNKCDEEARHKIKRQPTKTVASLPSPVRGYSLDVNACSRLTEPADHDACIDACTTGSAYYNTRNCISFHKQLPALSQHRSTSSSACPAGEILFICDSGTPDESKRCLSNPNPVGCHRL